MQGKRYNQARLVQEINIEALVLQKYILRHIDKAVDLSFIRERTRKLHSEGTGRHSIPPELILRLFLLQYLFDLSGYALQGEVAMHAGFGGSAGPTLTTPSLIAPRSSSCVGCGARQVSSRMSCKRSCANVSRQDLFLAGPSVSMGLR